MNKTYIYVLICPLFGAVRYVGKSVDPKRRLTSHLADAKPRHKSHVSAWIKSLKKSGLYPEMNIIEACTEDWVNREMYWINYYKNKGAFLCNLTNGGEGSLGHIVSEETRKKISINNARTTLITKPVFRFDSSGRYIDTFKTVADAQEKTGIKRCYILKSCNGIHFLGGGYIWSYNLNDNRIRPRSTKRKPVSQYDIFLNHIRDFDAVTDAAKFLGSTSTNISRCCRGDFGYKTIKGFIFKYK